MTRRKNTHVIFIYGTCPSRYALRDLRPISRLHHGRSSRLHCGHFVDHREEFALIRLRQIWRMQSPTDSTGSADSHRNISTAQLRDAAKPYAKNVRLSGKDIASADLVSLLLELRSIGGGVQRISRGNSTCQDHQSLKRGRQAALRDHNLPGQ